MSIVCHYFKSTLQSYKIVGNIEKKHKKITSLREVKKTHKRTLKTSAEKLGNYTREVGRLYTLSLPTILALCNRLKWRYVEFMFSVGAFSEYHASDSNQCASVFDGNGVVSTHSPRTFVECVGVAKILFFYSVEKRFCLFEF